MKYDEALKEWGRIKLNRVYLDCDVSADSVSVEMDFDEGYTCCGGSIPDCYCSFAESPSASMSISGKCVKKNESHSHRHVEVVSTVIPSHKFDFVTVLKEICEAGKGHVSL